MVETSLALTQSLVIEIYSSELPAGRGFHVTAATWLQLSRADFIKKLVPQLLSNDSLSMCHCRRLSRSCRNYDLNLPPPKKKTNPPLFKGSINSLREVLLGLCDAPSRGQSVFSGSASLPPPAPPSSGTRPALPNPPPHPQWRFARQASSWRASLLVCDAATATLNSNAWRAASDLWLRGSKRLHLCTASGGRVRWRSEEMMFNDNVDDVSEIPMLFK